jgi:hypothetical protein
VLIGPKRRQYRGCSPFGWIAAYVLDLVSFPKSVAIPINSEERAQREAEFYNAFLRKLQPFAPHGKHTLAPQYVKGDRSTTKPLARAAIRTRSGVCWRMAAWAVRWAGGSGAGAAGGRVVTMETADTMDVPSQWMWPDQRCCRLKRGGPLRPLSWPAARVYIRGSRRARAS